MFKILEIEENAGEEVEAKKQEFDMRGHLNKIKQKASTMEKASKKSMEELDQEIKRKK